MLGITTPDAIAFGMLVLAALAAWQGKKDGATAAKTGAHTDGMQDLAASVRELTEAIREGIDAKEAGAIRERLDRLERPR